MELKDCFGENRILRGIPSIGAWGVLWKKDITIVSVETTGRQMIACTLAGEDGKHWVVSSVYAINANVERRLFWNNISVISQMNVPMLVLGDFNVTLTVG